jgi:ArsR family transcriptional regulator, arsenate/arsenite/antimonite-responsive transcriptional repressor
VCSASDRSAPDDVSDNRICRKRAARLTAGKIADRFNISNPSILEHLSILENAGLIKSERRAQFIHYSLVRDNLVNTLNGYVQEVCPVCRPLKKESTRLARSES